MEGDLMLEAIRQPTSDEVDFYRENGWVKLDGVVPVELADSLLTVAKEEMGEDADYPVYSARGARYSAWPDASRSKDSLRSVSQSPELGRISSTLLHGRSLRWYTDTFMAKRSSDSGGAPTPWHQDLPQHAFDRVGAMTMWMPLVDCPPEKGSLRFLSGSHRAGPLGRFGRRADGGSRTEDVLDVYPSIAKEYEESPPLHLQVGDATVHDFLTVHSAPDNATESLRWVYAVTWFPAETLYTGADSYRTNDLGLEIDQPFDDLRFPVIAI